MKKLMKYKRIIIILLCIIVVGSSFYYYQHDGLCILGYHGVVKDEDYKDDNSYYHSASSFEKQMKYLSDHHYHTLTMSEVEDYMNGKPIPKKSVVITFDDGYTNFKTVVKPILKKYNLKATCFVIGDHTKKKGNKFLKVKQLKNDDIVEYYSHSYGMHHKVGNQKKIETMSLKQIDQDFKKNKIDCSYFAYPYGKDREDIDDILKDNGVHLAFTYNNFTHAKVTDKRYHIPRYMITKEMPFAYFKYLVS